MKKSRLYLMLLASILINYSAVAQTTLTSTIFSGGLTREYRIYIPAMYDGSVPVPLVFNFHGYGSNNVEQEQYGDFRFIADTANFILVHPKGTVDTQGSLSWNTFGGTSTVDDIGFVSTLIDSLLLVYNIDTTKIYSTGMSNGGFMTYDLACSLSQRIAAVASVTGSIITSHLAACNPLHPMPVMQIHGTADGTVPYNGLIIFEPIDSVINYWVNFNNCDVLPVVNQVPNIVVNDNCTAEHYVYTNGNSNVEVELYKIIDGGHSWPGAPVNINVTNMDFLANQTIWRFFRKYSLNSVTTNIQPQNTKALKIAPNPSSTGIFNLTFANTAKKNIYVHNQMGQLVQQLTCSGNTINIALDSKGVYFVTIQSENEIITKKLISN